MTNQQQLFDDADAPELWERVDEADRLVAEVVVDRPLDRTFEYLVPDGLRELVGPGKRVSVPFGRGNQKLAGYCVGLRDRPSTGHRLKELDAVLDREPLLSEQMLGLTRWIADRYLCAWGQVLETVIPAGVKKQAGTRELTYFSLAAGVVQRMESERWPAKQRAVLEVLRGATEPVRVDDVAERADCGSGPIKSLEKKGDIVAIKRRTFTSAAEESLISSPADQPDLKLNDDQATVLDQILQAIRAREHHTLLLHGITGSGKTEVYMQAIREVVSYGQQAIVLVPEISLTPQTIRRFSSRFPRVAVLHSHLTDSERHRQWQRISAGEVDVVVGARSAVFAPTPNLGLIVIDEEHETTFKQQSMPRYHARDVARERARRESVPLLLGSATPTLESIRRVKAEGDIYLGMPNRVSNRSLPPVSLVDTRTDPFVQKGHSIGRALRNAIEVAVKAGGQTILFLNLRGYSPVMWCVKCSKAAECPHCTVSLTWHHDKEQLLCHSCDFEMELPDYCVDCNESVLKRLGTGTQRLEKEVRTKFPDLRIARMDSDSMRKPGSHDATLSAFGRGEIDLLLGTQMIAKGLDFPNVTLVGVVDADTMLHQPDFRASERTYQLVSQVAGRTGRGDKGGRVLVQTMSPDDAVLRMAANHDFRGFIKAELAARRDMEFPPFASLARVLLRGEKEENVEAMSRVVADLLRETAKSHDVQVNVLGPAPAPLLRLKANYRYHLRLSAASPEVLLSLWRAAEEHVKLPDDVELSIDVDPIDMR